MIRLTFTRRSLCKENGEGSVIPYSMILYVLVICFLASCAQFIILEIGLAILCSKVSTLEVRLLTEDHTVSRISNFSSIFCMRVLHCSICSLSDSALTLLSVNPLPPVFVSAFISEACDVWVCSRFAAFISGCRVRTLAVWHLISGLGLGWICTSLTAVQNSGNVGDITLGARLVIFCTACTTYYEGCWLHPLLAVMAWTWSTWVYRLEKIDSYPQGGKYYIGGCKKFSFHYLKIRTNKL